LVLGVLFEVEEVEAEDSATAEKDRAGPFDSDMFLQILKPTLLCKQGRNIMVLHHQMTMWCSDNSKFLAKERF
jgi:hypothetical protein